MSERSYAGYSLDELIGLCIAHKSGDEAARLRYEAVAIVVLPFVLARLQQLLKGKPDA